MELPDEEEVKDEDGEVHVQVEDTLILYLLVDYWLSYIFKLIVDVYSCVQLIVFLYKMRYFLKYPLSWVMMMK